MRTSLLGPTYPFRGGIAHHTTMLYKELQRKHETLFISYLRQYPAFLFPGATDRDPSKQPLRADNVEYALDSMNPFTWLSAARRIVRFRPDVLIMPWWVVFWAPQFLSVATLVKRGCGARMVFLCHNVVEHESAAWKQVATRLVLSRADRIVTQSAQETRRVHELLGADIPVVTGFHPTYAELCHDVPERSEARRALGVSGKVLLFFGFVRPYKGLDLLLEAMPRVLERHDATLLVVGEFWRDKKSYLEQIKRLGLDGVVRVVEGYVPNEEVGTYFQASDLVIQPYRSISGSGVSQLAYGLGKPVVASRLGSLHEIIQDGVNGRLVPPENSEELGRAIVESLRDDVLAAMTAQARMTKDRFSWERLVDLLLEDTQAS